MSPPANFNSLAGRPRSRFMATFLVLFVIINWLCWAFVVGYLGKDREIGMGTAVAWSLLFSPLVGLIIALSSPRADPRAGGTPQDYDAALQIFERVVAIQPTANFLRNQPESADYARTGHSSRSVSATAGEDVFTTLRRLGKLKAHGLITEEEFSAQKQKILSS